MSGEPWAESNHGGQASVGLKGLAIAQRRRAASRCLIERTIESG